MSRSKSKDTFGEKTFERVGGYGYAGDGLAEICLAEEVQAGELFAEADHDDRGKATLFGRAAAAHAAKASASGWAVLKG